MNEPMAWQSHIKPCEHWSRCVLLFRMVSQVWYTVMGHRNFQRSPVTPTPEEEEETGYIVPNLTEAKSRGHAEKHACLLYVSSSN